VREHGIRDGVVGDIVAGAAVSVGSANGWGVRIGMDVQVVVHAVGERHDGRL
jgi:hypothetical protein